MAKAYAAKRGLVLDDTLTFHDLGVSAFRGQNADAGRLAYFLEAVKTGLVPKGSVLLVEQLDRLSRLVPRRAVRVLEDICDAGVSVVTLNDEREYTPESMDHDPMDLLTAVVTFMRANEESATKSRRLSQAWEAKREALGSGRPLTGVSPAWVQVSLEAGTVELDEDRAAIVRRIFDMTLAGVGQHLIADTFNREGLKPWGRARFWQRSYIAKILANLAVVGTMIPHQLDYTRGVKSRKPLEPLEGYYPAVVSPEVFADVQALRASKRAPGRGKVAGAPLSNILAGMAKCPLCGSTMTRVQKGARSRPSLVCVKAKAGAGCEYHSIPYAYIERAILERLAERLRDVPAGGPGNDDDEQVIVNLSEQQDALRHKARSLLDNLSFERSPALVARLRETETELEAVTATLSALLERREVTSGPLIGNRVGRVLALLCPEPPEGRDVPALADLEDTIDRAALNAALRGIFTRAVINWSHGTLEFEWTHGGTTELPFMWAI